MNTPTTASYLECVIWDQQYMGVCMHGPRMNTPTTASYLECVIWDQQLEHMQKTKRE